MTRKGRTFDLFSGGHGVFWDGRRRGLGLKGKMADRSVREASSVRVVGRPSHLTLYSSYI